MSTPRLGEHRYVSTACIHNLHDRCRLICKFCDCDCQCGCHKVEGLYAPSVLPPEPVDPQD